MVTSCGQFSSWTEKKKKPKSERMVRSQINWIDVADHNNQQEICEVICFAVDTYKYPIKFNYDNRSKINLNDSKNAARLPFFSTSFTHEWSQIETETDQIWSQTDRKKNGQKKSSGDQLITTIFHNIIYTSWFCCCCQFSYQKILHGVNREWAELTRNNSKQKQLEENRS